MTISQGLDEQIEQLWPVEFPDGERRLWAGLSADRKEEAVRRLDAIAGLTEGPNGRPPKFRSAGAAAKAAGMGLSTFYAVMKKWRSQHTLASLGVHAGGKTAASPAADESRECLRRDIDEILDASPAASTSEVVRQLAQRRGSSPPFTTVQRIHLEALRTRPPTSPFGCQIFFDNAGVDMVDFNGTPVRLCAAIDGATGLILGADLSQENDVTSGYYRAMLHALRGAADKDNARVMKLDGGLSALDLAKANCCKGAPHFEVRVLPGDTDGLKAFSSLPGWSVVEDARSGRLVVRTLGNRLTPFIWMGSGKRSAGVSYRTGRQQPPADLSPAAEADIAAMINAHNQARLRVLPRVKQDNSAALLEQIETQFQRYIDLHKAS